MDDLLQIELAAKYLGVTKQTQRNWDKTVKLRSIRSDENNYRLYSIDDLNVIKFKKDGMSNGRKLSTEQDIKRFISKIHRLIRDLDANSNIVDRFDELSKLLFLKLHSDISISTEMESSSTYAEKVRNEYKNKLSELPINTPDKFFQINLNDNSLYSIGKFMEKFIFADISSDLKGIAYEEMIKDTFNKGDNQQYFTPDVIVDFMCKAIGDLVDGTVCDPASGTGSFLIKLIKEASRAEKFIALEIDERLSWVSALNLQLHGCRSFESNCLKDGGSLGSAAEKYFGKIDSIITNPPFGSDFSDVEELSKYSIGKGRSSRRRGALFIERCLSLLRDGGWLAIIIDDSVLNSPNNEDVRKYILNNAEIHAVVSLPHTTFMPYATVHASILILKKALTPNLKCVTFFAKSEKIGKKPNGSADYIYSSDGSETLNSDLADILSKWFLFNERRSVDSSENIFSANVNTIFNSDDDHMHRIDFAYHHPSRSLVKNAIIHHADKLVRLDSICDKLTGSITPSKDAPDETILYTGLTHIGSNSDICYQVRTATNSLKSLVKKYEQDDILFSRMRPELRKAVAIDFREGGYCSSECIVLRIKDNLGDSAITPHLLAAILRSDFVYGQIVHLIAGIGRPRISVKELNKVMIPMPNKNNLELLTKEYHSAMVSQKKLSEKANAMLAKAEELKSRSTNGLVEKALEA